VAAKLEALVHCLRRRGLAVFWDATCLEIGDPLMETLRAAIGVSRVGVIVLTREAVESEWMEWEHSIMRPLQIQGRIAVLGLQLETGCLPVPGMRLDELIEAVDFVDSQKLCNVVAATLRNYKSS
jgi:hypothetical protein